MVHVRAPRRRRRRFAAVAAAALAVAALALAGGATAGVPPAELDDKNPSTRGVVTDTVAEPGVTSTVVEGATLVDPHTAETRGLDRVDTVEHPETGAGCGVSVGCEANTGGGGGAGGAGGGDGIDDGDRVPSSDSREDDVVSFQSSGAEAADVSQVDSSDASTSDESLKPGQPRGDAGDTSKTPAERDAEAAKSAAAAKASKAAGERDASKRAADADRKDKEAEEAGTKAQAGAAGAAKAQDAKAKALAARRAEESGLAAKKAAAAKAAAEDAAKKAAAAAAERETATQALPLTAGFTSAYGGGYAAPEATQLGSLCVLTGLARVKGGWSKDVARVPVACAPKGGKRILDARGSTNQPLRLNVAAGGQLSVMGPAAGWLTLGGAVTPSAEAKLVPLKVGAGWADYGRGWAAPSAAVEGTTVVLSGLLKPAKAGQWPATLAVVPPAMRPSQRLIFSVNQQSNSHRVDVLPDGRVLWVAGRRTQQWIPLAGIAYGVASAGQHPVAALGKGFSAYKNGYRVPSSKREDGLCLVSGLLRGKFPAKAGTVLLTLPADCRPDKRQIFYGSQQASRTRLDVLPDGRVLYGSSGKKSESWVSLDGIAFAASSDEVSKARADADAKAKASAAAKAAERKAPSASAAAAAAASAALAPVRNVLKLFAGFRPYGRDLEPPSAENYGGLCLAQGTLGGGRPAAVAGQLPTECNPATGRLTFAGIFNGASTPVDVRSGSRATFQFLTGAKSTQYAVLPAMLYPGRGARARPLSLRSPWTKDTGGFAPPTYTLSGKLCVLSGRARRHSTRPSHVAVLPAECRPAARLSFAAVQGKNAAARVDVHPNGFVQWVSSGASPSDHWLSLSGIAFTVRGAKAGAEVDVPGGARAGGNGFAAASYALHGKLCVLNGAVEFKSASHGNVIAQLPSECWPAFRTILHLRTSTGVIRADVGVTGVVSRVLGATKWTRAHLDGAVLLPADAGAHLPAAALQAGKKPVTQTRGLAMHNGWHAYRTAGSLRGSYGEPDVTRAGRLCVLHGVARGGKWAKRTVATLRDGACRPRGGTLAFNLHGEEGVTWRTDVDSRGVVAWKASAKTAGDWLSLSGAVWSTQAASPLSPATTWKNYGRGFRGAGFNIEGGVCLLSGFLTAHNGRASGGGSYIARVPSACRPKGEVRFNLNLGDDSIQVLVRADGKVMRGKGTPGSPLLSLSGVVVPTAKGGAAGRALSLGAQWKAAGGALMVPSYTLLEGGACALHGTAAGQMDPRDRRVASLPAACRPQSVEVFTSADSDGSAQRVDVLPDGTVLWMGDKAAKGVLSLDGLVFYSPAGKGAKGTKGAQAARAVGSAARPHHTKLRYQSGWRDFGESYQPARVTHAGALCLLDGKAHPGRKDGTVMVLPENCRPRATNLFNGLWHGGATARVDVYRDGRVMWRPRRYSGNPTGLALSGIAYVHAGAKITPAALSSAFQAASTGVESLGSVTFGDTCAVVGAARLRKGRLARGQVVATLAGACRPDRAVYFNANSQDGTVSVSVSRDGKVRVARATNLGRATNWLSLAGAVFTRSAAGYRRLAPGKDWKDSGVGAVRLAGYKKEGKLCVLSGAVKPKSASKIRAGSVLATLPDECRPAARLGFGINAAFPQTVRVEKDGRVVWLGGRLAGGQSKADSGVDFVSLDGIFFPAR